jgi:hypothetical protein
MIEFVLVVVSLIAYGLYIVVRVETAIIMIAIEAALLNIPTQSMFPGAIGLVVALTASTTLVILSTVLSNYYRR